MWTTDSRWKRTELMGDEREGLKDWHPVPGVDRRVRANTRAVNQFGDIRAAHIFRAEVRDG